MIGTRIKDMLRRDKPIGRGEFEGFACGNYPTIGMANAASLS